MEKNQLRPEGTYTKSYIRCRNSIKRWQMQNAEYIREYNKEYHRNYRKDPLKYQNLVNRIRLRKYLKEPWNKSKEMEELLGMSKVQFAAKHNMTEEELTDILQTHELNCIISFVHIQKPEYAHLLKYLHRHYNLEINKRYSNRPRNKYIDMNEPTIKLALLEMMYEHACESKSKQRIQLKKQIDVLKKQM